MSERKPLGKKIRFEVFKRDKFTCQYCGRMSPDVILEVDHINPVSNGGNDDILNLITSCRDCNRGKGKTRLSELTELKVQQDRLKELAERKEQIEMLAEWKCELSELKTKQIEAINNYIASLSNWVCSDSGKAKLRKLLHQFSFEEVFEAVEISFSQYYEGDSGSWDKAFNKIGGICYNRHNNKNSWD